jgi:hypothetical protein
MDVSVALPRRAYRNMSERSDHEVASSEYLRDDAHSIIFQLIGFQVDVDQQRRLADHLCDCSRAFYPNITILSFGQKVGGD